MATVLTDNAHYAAIASAIRSKNGLSATYTPSQMASAIAAIPSGSSAVLVPKSITQNGIYDPADDSADGYSSVDVSVQGGGVLVKPDFQGLAYAYISTGSGFHGGSDRSNFLNIFPVTSGHSYEVFLGSVTSNRYRVHFYSGKTISDFQQYLNSPSSDTSMIYAFTANISGSTDLENYEDRYIYTPNSDGVIIVGTSNNSTAAPAYCVDMDAATVPPDHAYYNGYLLPTIPEVSGYDYVFIRKNDQNGNFEALYGTSFWCADQSQTPTIGNWLLTYNGIRSSLPKKASITQTNPQQWTQPETVQSTAFGTDSGREVIWSSHDMLCGPNSSYDVLYKSGQAVDQTEADPNLGTKAITQNGTYYAEDDGFDGYSSVSVDVQGGGGSAALTGIVERTLSTLYDSAASFVAASAFYCFGYSLVSVELPNATEVRDYAFASCYGLSAVAMPSCTLIGSHAFEYCRALSEASFPMCSNIGSSAFFSDYTIASLSLPVCEAIGSSAFRACTRLLAADLPECRIIGGYAFGGCTWLASVSLPKCSIIGERAFYDCRSLMAVYVLASSVVTGVGSNTFGSSPMSVSTYTGSFGSIYVPSSLYEAYVSATGWSYYASRIASYTEA